MTTSHKVGRNEPCPCGSGRKFKVCCEGKTKNSQNLRRSPAFYALLVVVGIGVAIALVTGALGPKPGKQPGNNVSGSAASIPVQWPSPGVTSTGLTPQPPGPAPEGKVWSPEHGHWHDIVAAGSQSSGANVSQATTLSAPATLTPQPPGLVPEGKVWSPEHGHWHDIPTQPAAPVQP